VHFGLWFLEKDNPTSYYKSVFILPNAFHIIFKAVQPLSM